MRFAAENGLRVSGQSTGHGAVALGSLEDAILIKTERMRGVEIDAERPTARVGAGALWVELAEALGARACGLPGSPPTSASSATASAAASAGTAASTASPATGSARSSWSPPTASRGGSTPSNEPDLFWALRGGGGDFGVVTALEFELLPIAEAFGGALLFPVERAAEAVRAWREWAGDGCPSEVTSVGRLLHPRRSRTCRSRSAASRC